MCTCRATFSRWKGKRNQENPFFRFLFHLQFCQTAVSSISNLFICLTVNTPTYAHLASHILVLSINSSVLDQSTMQCRSLIRFLSVDIVIGFKGSSISNDKTIHYFPGQDPYPTWLCQMYIYHTGQAIQD